MQAKIGQCSAEFSRTPPNKHSAQANTPIEQTFLAAADTKHFPMFQPAKTFIQKGCWPEQSVR